MRGGEAGDYVLKLRMRMSSTTMRIPIIHVEAVVACQHAGGKACGWRRRFGGVVLHAPCKAVPVPHAMGEADGVTE
jgi:hypothetical protein